MEKVEVKPKGIQMQIRRWYGKKKLTSSNGRIFLNLKVMDTQYLPQENKRIKIKLNFQKD